jgi:hypothetical protein
MRYFPTCRQYCRDLAEALLLFIKCLPVEGTKEALQDVAESEEEEGAAKEGGAPPLPLPLPLLPPFVAAAPQRLRAPSPPHATTAARVNGQEEKEERGVSDRISGETT